MPDQATQSTASAGPTGTLTGTSQGEALTSTTTNTTGATTNSASVDGSERAGSGQLPPVSGAGSGSFQLPGHAAQGTSSRAQPHHLAGQQDGLRSEVDVVRRDPVCCNHLSRQTRVACFHTAPLIMGVAILGEI